MSVKIKDVAKKAGVSVTTVSRVLNGGKYVREELKEKVQNAMKELEYTPSYIARSLVLQKTNLLGVIVPDITSSMSSSILGSIEDIASQNNYNIVVCNMAESLEKQLKYLNIFRQMRVDGIIITNEKLNDEARVFISSIDIPTVYVTVKPMEQNCTSVTINNFKAAYDATEYLIGLGHKEIAFIGGDMKDFTSGQERYRGYKKALEDHKIQLDDKYVLFGNYKLESGYHCMKEFLKYNVLPTAVFAASDDMAVGALNCIKDNGIRVPEDISVIGFDGSNLTNIVRPKLTSMQQPIQEMGVLAVDILLQQINGQHSLLNEMVVKHKLVVRESCRAI